MQQILKGSRSSALALLYTLLLRSIDLDDIQDAYYNNERSYQARRELWVGDGPVAFGHSLALRLEITNLQPNDVVRFHSGLQFGNSTSERPGCRESHQKNYYR